ncbi:alpha-E domain-containing protein [Paracoccus sphaerophysae]|uniref:alpha-E domain-containing protein n=1 Tax=Paracoccus sphaerophysae TaxID=690417 RepID=UPI0023572C69|nr:alpha-E domain-containing protein [Paracoccus sphaerophysae]
MTATRTILLGRTADGLFWMARHIERAEAMARLIDAGLHMALTRGAAEANWRSVLDSAGMAGAFAARHGEAEGEPDPAAAIDFLLRDPDNPSSVSNALTQGRTNARMVRTALSRDAWEAVNEAWRRVSADLARPVPEANLPAVLARVKQATALIRGMVENTILRTPGIQFMRLGLHLERADTTARILDVKYYHLLPSSSWVGSALDQTQWDSLLRSVSAHKAYKWLYDADISAANTADFLILNPRMPRSLAFCHAEISAALDQLARDCGARPPCHDEADAIRRMLTERDIDEVFEEGLHEFLVGFLADNARLAAAIARDYRFTE